MMEQIQATKQETLEEKVLNAQLYVPLGTRDHRPSERLFFRINGGYMLGNYYIALKSDIQGINIVLELNQLSTKGYVLRHPRIMLKRRDVTR